VAGSFRQPCARRYRFRLVRSLHTVRAKREGRWPPSIADNRAIRNRMAYRKRLARPIDRHRNRSPTFPRRPRRLCSSLWDKRTRLFRPGSRSRHDHLYVARSNPAKSLRDPHDEAARVRRTAQHLLLRRLPFAVAHRWCVRKRPKYCQANRPRSRRSIKLREDGRQTLNTALPANGMKNVGYGSWSCGNATAKVSSCCGYRHLEIIDANRRHWHRRAAVGVSGPCNRPENDATKPAMPRSL
jgi:hypothetical protein